MANTDVPLSHTDSGMKMDEWAMKMMSMHRDMAAGTGEPKAKRIGEEDWLKNGLWTFLLMNILN